MKFIESLVQILIPQSDKAREKWVAGSLSKLKKQTTILDAGAGECYYRKYCQHLKYTSQDFGEYDGKGDKIGIQTGTRDSSKLDIISDIINMPIKSGSYDSVLCVEVFEHLPKPIEAIKELSRVLKKGGTLILTAPFTSHTHYSPYYFYSGFSINFYKTVLPEYGFSIKEIHTYGNFFDNTALELLRTPLVVWRTSKLLAIPVIAIYPTVIPIYIALRILSHILPKSSSLLTFGICIRAKKL